MIAEDVDGEALNSGRQSASRDLAVYRSQAPGFGDRRRAMMEDIAS